MEEKLTNIQIHHTMKNRYKQNIGCFNVKKLTQYIPILLLLDSILFYSNVLQVRHLVFYGGIVYQQL